MIRLTQVVGGGLILKQELITVSGNWNRPEKMAGNTVWLTMIGGGSSAASGTGTQARGGNGGQYLIQFPVDIGPVAAVECTIGDGGVATTSTVAMPGSTTSFGAFVSVLGGSAPPAAPNSFGSYGGIGKASGAIDSTTNGSDTPLGYGGRVITQNLSQAAGGGGLGLGITPPSANTIQNQILGAQGYGSGGTTSNNVSLSTGVQGAILIEWMEAI